MPTVMTVVRRAMGVETSESLAAQIQVVRTEQAQARAEFERLDAQVPVAVSFDEAQALARRADEQRWLEQKAAAQLPPLENRLAEARAREQAAALARWQADISAATKKLRKVVVEAAAVQAELIGLRESAKRELGEGLVERNIPHTAYNGLLLPDLVGLWEAELDRLEMQRIRRPAASVPAPRTVAPARLPHQRRLTPTVDSAHGPVSATPAKQAPGTLHAPRLPDDNSALGKDEVRCIVTRSGYQTPSGEQCHTGRRIRLQKAVAREAAIQGSVEILIAE